MDKNRDALRPDVIELISSSKDNLISVIVKPLLNNAQARTLPRGVNGRFVTMKPRTPTGMFNYSRFFKYCLNSFV